MATASITPDQDKIVAEVFIAAPPERVFQAIADPDQRRQWWGQKGVYTMTESHSDLRPGGKWYGAGVGANGPFRVEGEYLEIDPPRLLVYTWLPSWAHSVETVVRWQLEPQPIHGLHSRGPQKMGTGTLVRLLQSGFSGHLEVAKNHTQGWIRVLGWMQAFLETGETVETRTPISA